MSETSATSMTAEAGQVQHGHNYAGSAIGYPAYPEPTAEMIAKNDRCTALSYALQFHQHDRVGINAGSVVNSAKAFEAYLKGDA